MTLSPRAALTAVLFQAVPMLDLDRQASASVQASDADVGAASDALARLVANIERVLVGKRQGVELVVVALVAEGHALIEDVPGTGKTTLARALAASVDLSFRRVQCTSDLLPADVLGLSAYSRSNEEFVFRPGPIFAQVVLADELNRTSPRTQSAFLECMQERRVSVEGETRELPRPFFVVATQNPIEFEGTYPLPESELDRFLVAFRLGHANREAEREVLSRHSAPDALEALQSVLTEAELLHAIETARGVRVDPALIDYVLDVVEATRASELFDVGASTRAALGWVRAAKAKALVAGRGYCVPDDVIDLAQAVLSHRLVAAAPAEDFTAAEAALAHVLGQVSVPA